MIQAAIGPTTAVKSAEPDEETDKEVDLINPNVNVRVILLFVPILRSAKEMLPLQMCRKDYEELEETTEQSKRRK